MGKYDELFKENIQNPESFWSEVANEITWFEKFSKLLFNSYPPRWFVYTLITDCTTIFYEGKSVGTPNPGTFWRIISSTQCEGIFYCANCI